MDEDRLRLTVEFPAGEVERIARRAAELASAQVRSLGPSPDSPLMTVPEAAEYLRCQRQRIDDLLSQKRLTRVKDGGRTLIRRAELEAYLRGEPTGRLGEPVGVNDRPTDAGRRRRLR